MMTMRLTPSTRARHLLLGMCALLVSALLVAGCGNKNKRPDGSLVTDKDPVRGFLATIPADTPYAFVAAEPMPLGPALRWMESWASSLEKMIGNTDEVLADEYVGAEIKLVYAMISELSGNYNPAGMKKLGLSVSPRFALYGIGFLPALRIDLDDPDAFRAFVQRVETKSGFTSQAETLGNTDFWTYKIGVVYLVMSIKNRQLVWGFTPGVSAELYTSYLLGEKKPARSMADDDRITPIATKHGFKRFGTGFIDLTRIAELILEPGTTMHDEIQALIDQRSGEPTSPECMAETKRIVGAAPRIVFGYEEWSDVNVRFGGGVELTGDLGRQLVEASTPAPAIGSEFARQAPFFAAFGFDVGRVLDIFNGEMLAVQQNPYMCPWYNEINELANEATMFGGMVPAMLTNLRGGAVVLHNVRTATGATPAIPPDGSVNPNSAFGTGPSTKVEGLAVVNSTAPASLLAYLRTLAPEFEHVTPDPGGIPFALPASEQLEMFLDPHVMLTQQSLAIASGPRAVDDGPRAIAQPAADPTFMMLAYDIAQFAKILEPEGGATSEMLKSLALGRTEVMIEPRDSGIFIRMAMDLSGPAIP